MFQLRKNAHCRTRSAFPFCFFNKIKHLQTRVNKTRSLKHLAFSFVENEFYKIIKCCSKHISEKKSSLKCVLFSIFFKENTQLHTSFGNCDNGICSDEAMAFECYIDSNSRNWRRLIVIIQFLFCHRNITDTYHPSWLSLYSLRIEKVTCIFTII